MSRDGRRTLLIVVIAFAAAPATATADVDYGPISRAYGVAALQATGLRGQLERFDPWVHPISEDDDDGDVLGFLHLLAQPLQATTNGTPPAHVISVSYGVCESTVTADITQGSNALFGGSCCPARPGYDLASGRGSPLANVVAALL